MGVWTFKGDGKKEKRRGKKPQGHAANDEENNIHIRQRQQQQVSASQIRALGALCRVLSQVWRWRIAPAIPRLRKVWTKYAANLFCAELEGEGWKKQNKKKNRSMFWFRMSPQFALCFLFAMWKFSVGCSYRYYFCVIRINSTDSIIAHALRGKSEHVCSGSNGYF